MAAPAQAAPDAWIAATYPGAAEAAVELTISDGSVWPPEAAVPADRPVALTLINRGSRAHRFTMPDLTVPITLGPGQQETIHLTAAPGGHLFLVDLDPTGWAVGTALNLGPGGYLWAVPAGAATPVPAP
jgi:hypothetical protein